jgi:hypothetical protein
MVLVLAACQRGGDPGTGTPEPVLGRAQVDSVEVLILESMPVRVQVVARGTLPDGCTLLEEVSSSREGDVFTVVVTTMRPAEAVCTEMVVPFERIIPLDVLGLSAGRYSVRVNEASASFELQVDNLEPTPTPVDTANAALRGQVFHDLCGTAGGTAEAPEVVTDGCEEQASGGYLANGRLDPEEEAIPGVTVVLGQGPCPQAPQVESITDVDGEFSFSGLSAGTYCLSIDPLSGPNRQILIPGRWTAPDVDQGFLELTLNVGERRTGVNFGWDYELFPAVNAPGCENQAAFVEDVTVPDDTIFPPGQVFTKTWRVRNTGSCHWGPDYGLGFVAGDQLSGEAVSLPVVLAGEEVDLSVILRAPLTEGEFRGDWGLLDPAGEGFGQVGEFDLTFFVQIVVDEEAFEAGTIQGTVWDDLCSLSAEGEASSGCVEAQGGGFIADGEFGPDEPGLEDVLIRLYNDTCPPSGEPFTTTRTDDSGLYTFTNLDPGAYCVSIDPQDPLNASLLPPGTWTYPALDVATVTINLSSGETVTGVNFGWDFSEE